MPDSKTKIDGYQLFSNCREHIRGGGVGIYVRSDISAQVINDIQIPDELECLWVMLRPKRTPRSVSLIAVCCVYILTDSPYQDLLQCHLNESMDYLKTKHPDIGFVVLGDFYRMNVNNVLHAHDLKQLVTFPTRGDAILDIIMTNISSYFENPLDVSPIGKSDHTCIVWKPNKMYRQDKTKSVTKKVRPMKDSQIREFGSWVQSQTWDNVTNARGTQDKADALYGYLDNAVESLFPMKTIKIHSNNKPWVNSKITKLIELRQRAFTPQRTTEWRRLRNRVQREIFKAKTNYYANRVRHLQKTDPRKWHQQVKLMTNNNKSEVNIPIPGVEDGDHVGIANAINNRFVSVSDHLCPLDITKLEAYLPAPTPPPTLHAWDVYAELQKIKPSKACGPDGISPKLVKEFSYELSTPLTDLLNCSFTEGVVPKQWKRDVVVPIPKTHPPREDKLRPVSLTDCFAKVSESFITNWVLEDVSEKIDTRQFGNVKGVSTAHYLVSLLHFLHTGADVINNIGTVVLTDFSKAFDMVDHTLMIEKYIHLGVRGPSYHGCVISSTSVCNVLNTISHSQILKF
ncbi:uncharacterized protein [Amphiura filiformis]|uniref:uncharacterized protein n=1 Tax=Amphiura filiformis TaxID=82378 RepID=UPI003B219288